MRWDHQPNAENVTQTVLMPESQTKRNHSRDLKPAEKNNSLSYLLVKTEKQKNGKEPMGLLSFCFKTKVRIQSWVKRV